MSYFILDIETCPIDIKAYEKLEEEERKKRLNPIDSKIVAIGLRHGEKNTFIIKGTERDILEKFWQAWKELWQPNTQVVGFNISSFDIPFLVTRSFVNNVRIVPFALKSVVDLREKINAYRHGRARGTLKDFAAAMGMPTLDVDGSNIIEFCQRDDKEALLEYLKHDLLITDAMYRRVKDTGIIDITRW